MTAPKDIAAQARVFAYDIQAHHISDALADKVSELLNQCASALEASASALSQPSAPERVALTDEQIMEIAKNPMTCPCSPWWLKGDVMLSDIRTAAKVFARAVERAHGIGTSATKESS